MYRQNRLMEKCDEIIAHSNWAAVIAYACTTGLLSGSTLENKFY